jgi:hypothetical protein
MDRRAIKQAMTTQEYRQDRSRCSALARIMAMPTFQAAIAAAMQDMDFKEASIIQNNGDASPHMELRLLNQRMGVTLFITALKLMTEPLESAPPEPEPDYGAGEEAAKLANAGWEPVGGA